VLFQFGILFVAYLSLVHETRDIGRNVAVHPDTLDGTCTTAVSLWKQVCDDAPAVIDPSCCAVAQHVLQLSILREQRRAVPRPIQV